MLDRAVKSFSPPWFPPPLRAMPVRTPAPLLLRSYVFPYLRCRRIEIRDVYFSEGVHKVQMGTLMLGGVAIFNFFNPSTARVLLLLVHGPCAPSGPHANRCKTPALLIGSHAKHYKRRCFLWPLINGTTKPVVFFGP